MITAEIYKNSSGFIQGFLIKGHANKAKLGYDIYCAGVSMLVHSVFLTIKDFLKKKHISKSKHGYFQLEVEEPDQLTEAVFQTLLLGLSELKRISSFETQSVVEIHFLGRR